MSTRKPAVTEQAEPLLADLRGLIESARTHVAQTANATLTLLYWHIGQRIGVELLQEERAAYGQEIVYAVSRQLTQVYGKGFTDRNLWHMKRFAEAFPDEAIVLTLSSVLSWTHFRQIIYLERPMQREQDQISADLVFRDPYLLDFLGLKGAYSERDMEAAILADMEHFLLEMGDGFCFVARQKRMTIGPDDFYLDLLFYHRKLRRLVAVELKLDRFQAARAARILPDAQ